MVRMRWHKIDVPVGEPTQKTTRRMYCFENYCLQESIYINIFENINLGLPRFPSPRRANAPKLERSLALDRLSILYRMLWKLSDVFCEKKSFEKWKMTFLTTNLRYVPCSDLNIRFPPAAVVSCPIGTGLIWFLALSNSAFCLSISACLWAAWK